MIGEAVVQLLKDLQEGRGRDEYLYRCEFVTSQNRILAAIEGIDGQSWDVIRADVDECVKEGKTRMEKGFLDGAMTLLARNVLYGEVDDMSHWCKPQLSGNEGVKLDQVIKVVMNQVEKNGKPDCGCGEVVVGYVTSPQIELGYVVNGSFLPVIHGEIGLVHDILHQDTIFVVTQIGQNSCSPRR